MINHYKTLGISRKADAQELKTAYYALAKRTHPDAQRSPGAAVQLPTFNDVNQAYAILKDPHARYIYDNELNAFLERTAQRCSHCKGKGVVPKQVGYKRSLVACINCDGEGTLYAD